MGQARSQPLPPSASTMCLLRAPGEASDEWDGRGLAPSWSFDGCCPRLLPRPALRYRSRLGSSRDPDEEEARAIPLVGRAPRSQASTPSDAAATEDSGCLVTPSGRADGDAVDAPAPAPAPVELLAELGEARGLLERLHQLLAASDDVPTPSTDDDAPTEPPDDSQRQAARVAALQDDLRRRDERLFSHELRLRAAQRREDGAAEEAAALRARLAEREAALAAQQQQLDRMQRHVAALSRDLEAAVEERCRLSRDLARSCAERDRVSRDLHERIGELECRVLRPPAAPDVEHLTTVFAENMERLRSSLAANDPLHHTLDQLEHCFHYQAAAHPSAPPPPPPRCASQPLRAPSRPASLELSRDAKRQPITALPGFPVQRLDLSADEDERCTRLLYYTDRTVTPFMVAIPKRLHEVRLADIRRATAQHSKTLPGGSRLRFIFKTHDPEFGTAVKEEVRRDEDPVPAWEDKIIAWISDADSSLA